MMKVLIANKGSAFFGLAAAVVFVVNGDWVCLLLAIVLAHFAANSSEEEEGCP